MLADFVHKFVPGRLPVTALLLHGAGGDENDLVQVAKILAPGAAILSPRGKVMDQDSRRFFKLDRTDEAERRAELAQWVGETAKEHGLDVARLYALGYSNGATIAAGIMLEHAGTIAGGCLFRPRAVTPPAVMPSLAGAPVLISAGQNDELIPVDQPQATARVLTDAGARVDLVIQNAGHELTPADFSIARQWFARVMAL